MKIIKQTITLSLLSSVALLGATPNFNSGNIEKQIQAPRDIPIHEKPSVEIQGVDSPSAIKDFDESKKTFIKDFSFSGNTKISTAELKEVLKDYVGKELSFKQVKEVLSLVNKYYRSKGYFVTRAYLTPQDLEKNDNVLQITVLEGHYGEFKLENSSLVNDSVVQNVLDGIKDKDIISFDTIQRATNLVNDRAGAVVTKAAISPGEKTGTSNFDIGVEATKRVDGYIVADNYGSRYTGYNRLQALMNINSPFGIGDKITVSGLISNGADLKNGKLAYELPLNSYGLKSDFAYTRTNYDLVKEAKNLDANGKQDIYEVGLSYPLILKFDENLWTRVKYYHKDFKDYMDPIFASDEHKKINSFVASLDYDKNYSIGTLPARVFANLNLTTGHLSGENVDSGNYNKIDTYIANNIYLSEIFTLNSTLTAQKVLGDKNLDGSEDLSLGGPNGVRVYSYSEQNADNGYVLNFELLSKLPSILDYTHKVGVFYDLGDVYLEKSTDITFQRKTLQDVGIGYYSNYKDFFARVQMAWGINHVVSDTNESHRNSKLLLQAGWVF